MDVSATVPALSNELAARIIDFLAGDIDSLKSCTLAGRSLLYPARKLLHQHAYITIRNCQAFIALLNGSTDFGTCIRELHITISNPMDQEDSWVDQYVPRMALKLPNILHLDLKGDANGRYKYAPFKALQSVRRLTIIHTFLYDMNEFCSLIGIFPHLEVLYTHGLTVYRVDDVTSKSPQPSKVFKRSSFNSCRLDPGQFVDFLVRDGLLVNMEYFCVSPLQHIGLPPVGRLIATCGPALKHFKMALVGMKEQGGFVDLVQTSCRLDKNPDLRVMEFGSPAKSAHLYESDDIAVSWFPTMLSTIISDHMEEVVFNLWGGNILEQSKWSDLENIHDDHWGAVAAMLAEAPFCTLKRVVFHVSGDEEPAALIKEAVRETFYRFEEMGILHIDSQEDTDCA